MERQKVESYLAERFYYCLDWYNDAIKQYNNFPDEGSAENYGRAKGAFIEILCAYENILDVPQNVMRKCFEVQIKSVDDVYTLYR